MRSLPRAAFALLLPLLSGCPGSEKDRPPDSETTDSSDTSGADSTESAETAESVEETDTSGESDSETGESGESDTGAESGGDTETGTVDSGPVEGPWATISVSYAGCALNAAGGLSCFADGNEDLDVEPPPWGPYLDVDVGDGSETCTIDSMGAAACVLEPEVTDWCGLVDAYPDPLVSLSAGGTGVCGLQADGTPVCWGCDPIVSDTPRARGFVAISTGYDHVCAISGDGTIECWGEGGTHGELSPPAGNYVDLSVGSASACAVAVGGSVSCWGDVQDNLIEEVPIEPVSKVALHRDWACAILLDGELTCWGVGIGYYPVDWESITLPRGPFVDLAVGHIIACGLREDGTLACFTEYGEPFTDGVP